jgi:ABC-type multidrug transport system ATPase subunit
MYKGTTFCSKYLIVLLHTSNIIVMIEIHELQLTFPTGLVFTNLSLKINTGTHTCISGPSGSGKSSILKILQGYLEPDSGKIQIEGQEVTKKNISEIRSAMAYVPQNIHLPVNNGMELIRMLACAIDLNATRMLLVRLGLDEDMLERAFDAMSGGQKQRVIIAICLSLGRKIILLDEPTASLDDEAIGKLIDVIRQLKEVTVISASHNPEWKDAANFNLTLK